MVHLRIPAALPGLFLVLVFCTRTAVAVADDQPSESGDASIAASARALGAATEPWAAPITEQDALAFGEAAAAALLAGDVKAYNRLIDWDRLVDDATSGVEGGKDLEELRRGFRMGVLEGNRNEGFARQLADAIAKDGTYTLLRVRQVDGKRRVLFRMLVPEQGVNYHEYILGRDERGRVRAMDMHVYLTGETLSQTFRRLFLYAVASVKDKDGLRADRAALDLAKHGTTVEKMGDAVSEGRFRDVLRLYETLPPALRKDKSILLMRLLAAQEIGPQTHAEAAEMLEQAHPNDPSLALALIDGYALRGEHAKVLELVSRLEKSIGGDPYLKMLAANTNLELGQVRKARELAQEAIRAEPDLQDAYWSLVSVSLAEKDFDETVRLLNELQQKFSIEFADLTTIPLYADFVQSPQYERWISRQTPAAPGDQ